ncbi:hypothetical protein NDU88_006411 [Pleurodeles waltl]|uniref:Uncharacterized protein n=1 Tax=Pleurodeles waltl TaxID=8319 RepID=A0AAV7UKW9_PLEWA|nr:hypothetical protein NDU88_006411 [Pleurodeles waltl]
MVKRAQLVTDRKFNEIRILNLPFSRRYRRKSVKHVLGVQYLKAASVLRERRISPPELKENKPLRQPGNGVEFLRRFLSNAIPSRPRNSLLNTCRAQRVPFPFLAASDCKVPGAPL